MLCFVSCDSCAFIWVQDFKVGLRKKELIESLHSSYKDGLWYDDEYSTLKEYIYFLIHNLYVMSVFIWYLCSPLLPNLMIDKTSTCVRISSFAESLLWRVQVMAKTCK